MADARDALASLSAPIAQVNGQYAALGASLTASHAQAAAALRSGDDAAYADAMRAAKEAISEQIKTEEDGLMRKLAIYADEARHYQITQQEKVSLSRAALDEEYAAQLALLQREGALGAQTLAQKQRVQNQILDAERRHQDMIFQITRQSLDQQQRQYEAFGETIARAFNSQLHGLLSGTETWRAAFKNILEDLLIRFIEWSEYIVVKYVAGEAAKTAATTAGVAARTGAEQAGAAASLASQGAAMIRSILSSAAEAFAGVFGFLAPIMGPLAAGPATAAYGAVAGMAGSVASADIGMWSVPADMLTLVHHNELIMPAAQAGAFRDMLSGDASQGAPSRAAVHVHPTTNFHVSAVDSGSVAQWMKSNSATMIKAIDEAVRHGAHLGTRRLALP
jgi:hypothetical protein